MLESITELSYAIVLCDDMEAMKDFYRHLLPLEVETETDESLSFRAGGVRLGLRKRTRGYDGQPSVPESPGLQLAFRVSPEQVESCYQALLQQGVPILEPPTDQPRGHRTVYFADPQGNVLEVYAEI